MNADVLNALVPSLAIVFSIGLPICVGGYLFYFSIKTRHTERIDMIRQGIMPPDQSGTRPKAAPSKYIALRSGFLCIGIALGIILGFVSISIFYADLTEKARFFIPIASVLFFLGIAYTLFYLVVKNKNLDQE